MAKLADKIQNALDECRILVLATQVLLGLQFRSCFEEGFDKLPDATKLLVLVALGCLLASFVLVVGPGTYHRISERGEDTVRQLKTTNVLLAPVLFLLSAALGLNLYLVGEKVLGPKGGAVIAVVGSVAALALL